MGTVSIVTYKLAKDTQFFVVSGGPSELFDMF